MMGYDAFIVQVSLVDVKKQEEQAWHWTPKA
jgi:hypothetical protein